MIVLVEGFYLHEYISVWLLVHSMNRFFGLFFNVILQNHARLSFFSNSGAIIDFWYLHLFKYFFFTFLFFLMNLLFFGEAMLHGCKIKWFSKLRKTNTVVLCRNTFIESFYQTFMDSFFFFFFLVFILMVGWRSCASTLKCNFKYIFIFHFSQLSLTLFVQNSFLVLFFWGEGGGRGVHPCEKISDFRTVHICCFEHICIFVMCWKINTRKPTLQ